MQQRAYRQGAYAALVKFALDAETAQHIAELAGLGLLSVPVAHHLLADPEKQTPAMHKGMAATELAGLGVLAAPAVHHLLKA